MLIGAEIQAAFIGMQAAFLGDVVRTILLTVALSATGNME